jgi:hypothetical protein
VSQKQNKQSSTRESDFFDPSVAQPNLGKLGSSSTVSRTCMWQQGHWTTPKTVKQFDNFHVTEVAPQSRRRQSACDVHQYNINATIQVEYHLQVLYCGASVS